MKAVAFAETGAGPRLVERHVADPEPGPRDVILRVCAAGVCGTDLHLAGTPAIVPPGAVLGHEFSGEVVELGTAVKNLRRGERITALPYIGCAQCPACESGDGMGCPQVRQIGSGDLPGAFAELVRVGAAECHHIPETLPIESAALTEPLAFARHATRVARLTPESRVLVLGAGPIGLAITTWARACGIRALTVADPNAARRTLAQEFGASSSIDPSDPIAKLGIGDLLGGPPDVVFECVGKEGILQECVELVGRRGRIISVGAAMALDPILPAFACLREVELRFVVSCSHQDFAEALQALANGLVAGPRMVTDQVSLDDLPRAFEQLYATGPHCKVLVRP